MTRRLAFDSVGGFDESYFMYVEDVDLCWRLGRAGWRTRFEPAAEVVHFQGVSTSRRPYRMLVAHHRSLWRFARRSSSGRDRALLPLVAAGLVARCALACALHRRASRSARP
jgi:N-acetylglucosaminyl-diphospho-decaprenol L-rhamnosyltransferase